MCIAVVVKQGMVLKEETIDRCWKRNDDGAGFAYVRNGGVVISKGHMHLDDLKEKYFEVANSSPSNMLVHFRIRTSGETDKGNTHPFKVKDGAMIHNGILFYPSGSKSDTRMMVERWYNKLNKENIIECTKQLGSSIGGNNKLAFLFNDDTYHIVNEEQGMWTPEKTVWFSNSGWK